jgi:hypothetical protein
MLPFPFIVMPVNVIKARLNSLRKNLPSYTKESAAREFNSMVQQLEEELQDPEIASFLISESDIKPRIVSFVPGRQVNYSEDKYCDNQLFKRQVDGLWEYLVDSRVIDADNPEPKRKSPPSQTIHIHGDVTGSTIQQGSHNTATANYQNDVRQVVEEIRPAMNAAKLTAEAKDELRAEVETVEAQVKSPRPKHSIIRESLLSARRILEHAFGAGLAHAYFPLLVKFLEHHH